ncbi:MAG: hypothetical protein J0M36_00060 [Caulobacterales bacterium]|nr:hypothetical protein [Caulobacterales bacterium]
MSRTYNLPPLKARGSFPDPDRAGEWMPSPGTLAEMGARLDVKTGGGVQDVKSVPDAWAQPRTFADALITADHPLETDTVEKWRALLALFALEHLMADFYKLSARPVRLKADGPRLDRILLALLPTQTLPQEAAAAQADWRTPWLIHIETVKGRNSQDRRNYDRPRLIGALSPASLVSPGRACDRTPIPVVPWMAGSHWIDPLKLKGDRALSAVQRRALQTYLDNLAAGLETLTTDYNDPVYVSLRDRVTDFADACGEADTPYRLKVRAGPRDGAPTLYELVRTSVELGEQDDLGAPAELSECRVALRADFDAETAPFKGVILVDPAIAEARGKPARDVVVWGATTLAEVLDSEAALLKVQTAAAEANYLVARPSALFTRKFLRLALKAVVPGHPAGLRDALLPLTPLALLLMKPTELAEAIEVRSEGGSGESVSLKLKLEGHRSQAPGHADGWVVKPAEFTMRRVYADQPEPGQGERVDEAEWNYGGAAVWPDIASSKWNWYFARLNYSTKMENNIRARFAVSGRAFAEMLKPLAPLQKEAAFRPLCADDDIVSEAEPYAGKGFASAWNNRVRPDNDAVVEELQSSPFAFEAIFFAYAESQGASAEPAGMTLLRPTVIETANEVGIAAVDFGTTNTVACFEDGLPVVFGKRTLEAITSSEPARNAAAERGLRWPFAEIFFPLVEKRTPTPTVVVQRAGVSEDDHRTLFSSLIYFQPDLELKEDNDDEKKFRGVLTRASFNLKWHHGSETGSTADFGLKADPSPRSRILAGRFLRQMMMMIGVEALARNKDPDLLEWRFSRPDAQRTDGGEFLELLRRELRVIRPAAEARMAELKTQPIRGLYSEGRAAANYVLSGGLGDHSFVASDLNIVLDIGGGTTDVAIWADNRPLWRGSLRLAGQDFFTAHVIKNPALLRDRLNLGAWAKILAGDESEGIGRDRLPHVGELLFSGPVLERALDDHWLHNSGTEECQALTRSAFTFLGGVAWYLGLVARGLIAQGDLRPELLTSCGFALCGRGAGLFKRMHGDHTDARADTPVSRLLTLFSLAADGQSRRPSVFMSPIPKLEVANGMVIRDAAIVLEDNERAAQDFEPSGLAVQIGSVVMGTETDIIDFPHQGSVSRPDLAEFDTFLKALAEHSTFALDIQGRGDQSAAANIRNKLLASVQKAQARGEVPLEPLFVSALRHLLGDLTTPGYNNRLSVGAPSSGLSRRERRTQGATQ